MKATPQSNGLFGSLACNLHATQKCDCEKSIPIRVREEKLKKYHCKAVNCKKVFTIIFHTSEIEYDRCSMISLVFKRQPKAGFGRQT